MTQNGLMWDMKPTLNISKNIVLYSPRDPPSGASVDKESEKWFLSV